MDDSSFVNRILSPWKFQFLLTLHVDVKNIRGRPFPTPNTFIILHYIILYFLTSLEVIFYLSV